MNWSSVSELDNTSPFNAKRRVPTMNSSRQTLTAKDREGMRNIVGGRPESAPICIRNANRMDGLQDSHCPSPNMPRHVLESITQSPTQSMKHTTSSVHASSITDSRYQDSYNKDCMAEQKIQYTGQNPVNGEYLTQQALYREQYLQQTGIITVTPQYNTIGSPDGGNVLRNNPYVQHFQIANSQHFPGPRRRDNGAQMT